MAHFARIEDGIVREVIVVNNEMLLDAKKQEKEALGIAFCKSLYGEDTNWVQTSFNNSSRKHFAGVGMIYNADADEFQDVIYE